MARAADSLRTFVLDIMTQVHAITVKGTATKQELQVVGCKLFGHAMIIIYILSACLGGLENLEVMLHVVRGFGEDLPEACQNTCQEMWTVFDNFITKYGNDYGIAERTTRVLRHGITLYGKAGLNVAPSVVARMAQAFTITGFPSYLWIAGKIVSQYGSEESPALRASFLGVYETATSKVVSLLQEKTPGDIPDGLYSVLCFPHISDLKCSHRGLRSDASTACRLRTRRLLSIIRLPSCIPGNDGSPYNGSH